ncbi:MAG: polysaccharide lyase 8 family protein, partial [Verrucomicrobiota bacterium]|nr:polysaccharide lyase 8 family protein [Verrucomicrobiota bacterium]
SLLISSAVAVGAVDAPADDAVATVKARLREEVRRGQYSFGFDIQLARTQQPDGSWPDIQYTAKDRMSWPPMEHLNRLFTLAWFISYGVDVRRGFAEHRRSDADLAAVDQAFVRAFDCWVARDPKSDNWWYNEIGAPQKLYGAMLLAEPLLTDGRVEKGCALLARAKLGMTGQNLVWLSEIVIGRACLQRNAALMAEAFKRIEAEIVVTEKEGIQPDFSFHQHGAQLYSGGYGYGFASSVPRFAVLAQGTPFAFQQEKIRILENYLLDGQQWMIRGGRFDHSASGRELTRPNSGSVAGLWVIGDHPLLRLDATTRRAELERFVARSKMGITEKTPALSGHRHFWRADYTVHHTPAWLVSVRMTSDRLLQTEEVNEENLLGEHLSDGVMYIYLSGEEYRNIFPVWDWARLPGITAEHDRPIRRIDSRRKGARAFAGGVSNGTDGAAAMDFERDGLTARKAWFFTGDTVVCLGAGIASTNGYRVITSVDQCLARGPVTVKRADGEAAVLAGPENIERPAWVYHGGVGTVFLDAGEIGIGASVQTGSWKRISAPQSPAPVSAEVFSLWVNHGPQPQGARYAYVVTPQRDAAALDAFAQALPLRVLANTPAAQAVARNDGGALQAAFYAAGEVAGGEAWGTVGVDVPCLLMLAKAGDRIQATVSNPVNKGGRVRVTAGGRSCDIAFPDGPQAGASAGATF